MALTILSFAPLPSMGQHDFFPNEPLLVLYASSGQTIPFYITLWS